MRLQLLVEVPASADRDDMLKQLALSQASGHGITITTSRGVMFDVDLVIFENQGSGMQEVTS